MIKKILISSLVGITIFTIPVEAKTFQESHSCDWGIEDAEYLLKLGEYLGGDKYDQCYNMIVCLNNVWKNKKSIPETAKEVYEDIDKIEFSQTSLDALELIYNNYDATAGDLEYEYY